jgi:hypothetical protein
MMELKLICTKNKNLHPRYQGNVIRSCGDVFDLLEFIAMKLLLCQADAFTEKLFGGNPAADIPLPAWLHDETMQKIARENNLAGYSSGPAVHPLPLLLNEDD